MSVVIETGDAPLDPEQLAQLRSAAAGKTRAERGRLIPGVGREGMAQALAGLPIRPATRALIRMGLERLACDAASAFNRASVPGDETRVKPFRERPARDHLIAAIMSLGARDRSAAEDLADSLIDGAPLRRSWQRELAELVYLARNEAALTKPVCPRCLGLTPGTPGGTPETPHPGPFTEELCAACSRAVERDLRKEGRIQAADFEAKRRERAVKP